VMGTREWTSVMKYCAKLDATTTKSKQHLSRRGRGGGGVLRRCIDATAQYSGVLRRYIDATAQYSRVLRRYLDLEECYGAI
jgi:hypothetical protein